MTWLQNDICVVTDEQTFILSVLKVNANYQDKSKKSFSEKCLWNRFLSAAPASTTITVRGSITTTVSQYSNRLRYTVLECFKILNIRRLLEKQNVVLKFAFSLRTNPGFFKLLAVHQALGLSARLAPPPLSYKCQCVQIEK